MQTILEAESGGYGTGAMCDCCVSASFSSDDEVFRSLRREHIKRDSAPCVAYIRDIGADDIGEPGRAYRE